MMSFLILAPIALIVEGVKFTPGALQALGIVDCKLIYMRALGAALTFHLYQQVSYMILSRVTPVTHAIGNCTKRCAPGGFRLGAVRVHNVFGGPCSVNKLVTMFLRGPAPSL